MENIGNVMLITWLLTAVAVSSFAEKTEDRARECSQEELSKIGPRYAKHLQNRVLYSIYFTDPNGRNRLIKQRDFKKRLMLVVFNKVDKNKNGLLEPSEAVAGKWSLRGSTACKFAFLRKCDEDGSKNLSRQEWLKCFNIQVYCNKSCARGRLDTVLCQCRCPQSVIQGRVVSSSGASLRDASIFWDFPPHTEMTKTSQSGHFTVKDNCESLSFSVMKKGYIPYRSDTGRLPDTHPVLIRLEDAEPPSITVDPNSKTRIAGESVNFTCEAEGTPPIKITWHHNGRPLQEVTSGNRAHLFIGNVTGAQGLYTCKATNDYGSEISTPAELKIKENVLDTCSPIPKSHIIQLLGTCRVKSTGQNFLDVGKCEGLCAQRSSFNQSCGGKGECCCGPKGEEYLERVLIDCSLSNYPKPWSLMEVYRVKECGCSACIEQETVITGEIVGGPNREPIENVRVLFRKNVVDQTKENGEFSFVVNGDVDRVTVTFQDPEDRFFDTTQTLPLQRGRTMFHRIVLQEEDPPVTFDSTKKLEVPLGHAGDNMAELELPANNLLRKDGTPFQGKAKLRVSLTDPRNVTDLFSAPGDFTTVDQSGDVQPLKTYGILRIKVQDRNNEQLDLARNVKLRLDADKIMLPRNSSGEMAPWLWWLDEKTGRWRQLGEMRPASNSRTRRDSGGRRFYIGDIQTDKISPIINIDILWKRCYVRVQANVIDGKNLKPADGITVTLIGKESAAQEQYYGYTQKTTNKNGLACIPAWCDSGVVLQAGQWLHSSIIHANPDKTNLETLPSELETSIIESEESSSFTFTTKVTSQAGPIFSNNEINKCFDPDENVLAFKFYLKEIRRRCYVRAQTYIHDQSGKNIEPDHMALVTLIENDNTDPEKYPYGYPYEWANSYGKACVEAWCGSEVSLQAKRSSEYDAKPWFQLKPDKTSLDKLPRELEASVTLNSFTFTTKVTSEVGPIFYSWHGCASLDDSLLAFKFYYTDIKPQPKEIDEFGTRPPGHPLSWYTSDATEPSQEVNKCFVKVKIHSYQGIPVPMVSVHSFTSDRKIRYGYSVKRPTITGVTSSSLGVSLDGTNYSVSFACVEYRCSEKDRETFIVVKFLTNRCFIYHPGLTGKFKEQSESYRKLMNITSFYDKTTAIYAPADVSDGTLGLYTGPGKIAEERCQAGRVDNIGRDGNRKPTSDGYSLFTIYGCESG